MTHDEKYTEAFKKMKDDLAGTNDKKNNDVSKNTIKIEATSDIIQDWMKEFDELYKSTGILSSSIKTVEYNGKRLSQLGFLNLKQQEFSER